MKIFVLECQAQKPENKISETFCNIDRSDNGSIILTSRTNVSLYFKKAPLARPHDFDYDALAFTLLQSNSCLNLIAFCLVFLYHVSILFAGCCLSESEPG